MGKRLKFFHGDYRELYNYGVGCNLNHSVNTMLQAFFQVQWLEQVWWVNLNFLLHQYSRKHVSKLKIVSVEVSKLTSEGDTVMSRRLRWVPPPTLAKSSPLGVLVFSKNDLKTSFDTWLNSFIRFEICLLPIRLLTKFDEFKNLCKWLSNDTSLFQVIF